MDKRIIYIAALNIFEGKLQVESAILDEAFDNLDACVEKLEFVDIPLSWIAGYTLKKAGSTSLKLYKMILDGALSERREMISSMGESLELLIYIGAKSLSIEETLPSNIPAAGETANKSNEKNKLLREGLNTRAAQLGFTYGSLQCVINHNCVHSGTEQPQDFENLQAKINTFYRVLIRLIIEGANCLGLMSPVDELILFERLQAHIEQSHAVFGPPGEGSDLPTEDVA